MSAEQPVFVPGPVPSAGAVPLSESSSGQPVMAEAILDFFRPLTITVVTAEIQTGEDPTQDGVVREVRREVKTSGCVQAGDEEKLEIQAGGERSWQSCVMHTAPDFNVATDTVIILEGMKYRVVAKRDFSVNGFIRYKLTQDYERAE